MKGLAPTYGVLGVFLLSLHPSSGHSDPSDTPVPAAAKTLRSRARKILPAQGQVRALVVFARFADETALPAPDGAEHLLDAARPGSFAHFYQTMSFGQLQVEGEVLTKRYASNRPASAYLAKAAGEDGNYGEFAREIVRQVDADIDLSRFDNDGPDGIPDSGDDDGYADYLFICLQSTPARFVRDGATGIAGLGFAEDYDSADTAATGEPVRVSGARRACGALLEEGTFSQTVGSMAHEFGHGLGLPDLYDRAYDSPAEDGAGIGRWGLMGWGAGGWNGGDGPNPLCAWSREQLGWIGRGNDRLVELQQDEQGLQLTSLDQGGYVYKVPLGATVLESGFFDEEYLLLESRSRTGSYYDRNLPAEGLLVWHIRPYAHTTGDMLHNSREESKVVDLVCADGRDDLDFWAHDDTYCQIHGGNQGDATDPFDGIRFTSLDLSTNPSTRFGVDDPGAAFTGAAIRRIRPEGRGLRADVALPRWAGTIRGEVHWAGQVLVDGDLTVAPEGRLVVHDNTRVRFAGQDRLEKGQDPRRCEFRVEGVLRAEIEPLYYLDPDKSDWRLILPSAGIEFAAQEPGQTWYLLADPAKAASFQAQIAVRDAVYGTATPADVAALEADHPTAVLAAPAGRPEGVALLPNYPNPFNAETAIRFALDQETQVRLVIYNALGQTVRTLVDGARPAGVQTVVWDGRDEGGQEAGSGAYFGRLEVEGHPALVRPMSSVR